MALVMVGTVSAGILLGGATPSSAQSTGSADPSSGPLAEADATIARLRQDADALAGRYFDALAGLADVQRRIDEIEGRLPQLAAEVDELRGLTQVRAVAAYKRSGNALGLVIAAVDPMEAARRVQWLDRLNARDDALAADLKATAARLASQRGDLRTARDAAATALDEVREQGRAIDALLADAEERRRIAATPPSTVAETEATTSTTTTTTSGSRDGPTTTTTSPKPSPPIAPPTYTPTPGVHPRHDEPFLVCTRARESSGNYAAVNPAGPYLGAYQFLQTTWNSAANHAGRPELIGVPPSTASQYDQDDVAWALYQWQGSRPWGGICDPE